MRADTHRPQALLDVAGNLSLEPDEEESVYKDEAEHDHTP